MTCTEFISDDIELCPIGTEIVNECNVRLIWVDDLPHILGTSVAHVEAILSGNVCVGRHVGRILADTLGGTSDDWTRYDQ